MSDCYDLPTSLAQDGKSKQKMYIECQASFLSKLLFNENFSGEHTDLILVELVGFLETIIDQFHPKTNLTVRKYYY